MPGMTLRMEASVRDVAEARMAVMDAATVAAVLTCDARLQAAAVAALRAEGALVDLAEAAEGDDDLGEEGAEETDAEIDPFLDDDERRDDAEQAPACGAVDGAEEGAETTRPRYALRVVRRRSGWACVPPRNPHAALAPGRWGKAPGQLVHALRRQFAVYAEIARWLEEDAAALASPSAFLARRDRPTRKGFAAARYLDEQALGRAVRVGCLAWREGTLPLGCAFGDGDTED